MLHPAPSDLDNYINDPPGAEPGAPGAEPEAPGAPPTAPVVPPPSRDPEERREAIIRTRQEKLKALRE